MIVIGIDAVSWKIIKPNLESLPNFKNLLEEGKGKTINLDMKPISAAVWASIFSGKYPKEHKHTDYVKNGKIQKREDIKVKFIWDILNKKYEVVALNVPFVIPPYNFNIDFEPIGYGLPTTEEEWEEELERVTKKSKQVLKTNPDLFITVYTLLDRIQHFHWGEPVVLEWYRKVNDKLEELIPYDDKILLCSDHGFCNREEAEVQTLPAKTPHGKIKGDHSTEAILITKNIDYPINKITDIFQAIKSEFK